ncbi:MAG TPA: tetratricopeptide repeat protein, partial [Pirellulales bacterium]|nr:tetratricopeptide repeat protein [Pirellulales bacterium]
MVENGFASLRSALTHETTMLKYCRLVCVLVPALFFAARADVAVGQLFAGKASDEQALFDSARDAFDRKDFKRAEDQYRKLIELQPDNEIFQYNLAMTLENQGRHKEAKAMMSALAPRDAQGFAMAHRWLAMQLFRDPGGGKAALDEAEAHLLRACKGDGRVAADAHALLGQMYRAQGRFKDAEEHFLQAKGERPELKIALAQTYVLQGKLDAAREEAEEAVEYFGRLEQADLDDHTSRIFAAEALTFLERFSEAVALLDKGRKLSNDPRYPIALGRVYLTWEEWLRRAPKATIKDHVALLSKSLESDPTSIRLQRRLINALHAGGDEAQIGRDVLRNAIAEKKVPAVINLLLGIEAFDRDDTPQAIVYLRRAKDADPRAVRMLCEMAKAFVNFPPADFA